MSGKANRTGWVAYITRASVAFGLLRGCGASAVNPLTDAGSESAHGCLPAPPDSPPHGACTVDMFSACRAWALAEADGGIATCASGECIRAGYCITPYDLTTCACGNEHACNSNEVCVQWDPGQPPSCRCRVR